MITTKNPTIPRKLLKNSIFTRLIRADPFTFNTILIDKSGFLFEISEIGVINVLSLDLPQNNKTFNIEFHIFFSYKNLNRNIFYLIKVDHKLFVIQRQNQLKLIKTYVKVQGILIQDSEDTGKARVKISLEDEIEPIITENFTDDDSCEKDELPSFEKVLQKIHLIADETRKESVEAGESYSNLYQNACDKLKFVPKCLRSDNQLEKVVLVPYANSWKRIHNGFLVIGAPILNSTYQRPIVAHKITSTVICYEITDFEYSTCLYKCEDDYHSIEELKKKLEALNNESDIEDNLNLGSEPKFEREWLLTENGRLNSEESGIVIILIDIQKLLNSHNEQLTLKCFINYEINGNDIHESHELQLHFGDISITQKELLSTEHWVKFESHALLDILTITSTSISIKLDIQYNLDSISHNKFIEFLTKQLGFKKFIETHEVNTHLNENEIEAFETDQIPIKSTQFLLYQDEGYLKGTLIRYQKNAFSCGKIKMYVSDETKLISLIRTFINEFDENCKISVTDQNFKEKSVIELQNCLKEEILHLKLNQNENFETFITKHCMLQAKSDAVFNDLRKICNKNVND